MEKVIVRGKGVHGYGTGPSNITGMLNRKKRGRGVWGKGINHKRCHGGKLDRLV